MRDVAPGGATIDLDQVEHSADEVCILGNLASRNFGHWTEELLKVLVLEHSGFAGSYVITQAHPKFAHESLELMGIDKKRIVAPKEPIIYSAALFTSVLSHFTASQHACVILKLRDMLHEAVTSQCGAGERIWIDRGFSARRTCSVINAEEVHACVNRHGFTAVDIGAFPFGRQVAIARDMEVMSGPHGSGFVHCQFMRNRKEIIEIFPPTTSTPASCSCARRYSIATTRSSRPTPRQAGPISMASTC